MANQHFLKVSDICMSFSGVQVLKNVNMEVEQGTIHALIGENGAGKSTLMKILLGIHRADSGAVELEGKLCGFKCPQDALSSGIAMIHQEISLIPNFDVAENVWLGRERLFLKSGMIDKKKRRIATEEIIKKYDLNVDIQSAIRNISVAQMQLVELIRAISYDAKLIIMDEPTSALSNIEIEILFRIMRDLAARGKTIIFISHKLEELFEICDNVTILCDGNTAGTYPMKEITKEDLIRAMVGRDLTGVVTKTKPVIGEVVFECEGLSGEKFHDVSFNVRAGEIVGLCGLMGAGRTEILNGIFGIDPIESGEIRKNGKTIKSMTVRKAIANGIAMVNEDRLRMGVITGQPVKTNMSIVVLSQFAKAIGLIDVKSETKQCGIYTDLMKIKMHSYKQSINNLSGGNQQKVIIGRWLMAKPGLLILDEPTRGIDIGAKAEVHKLIDELAHQGQALIMASSELPELLTLCDRILVVRGGRIVAEMNQKDATQDSLMKHAFGT